MNIVKDNFNQIIDRLGQSIERLGMTLNDTSESLLVKNVTEKNIEQYKLIRTIILLKLKIIFEEITSLEKISIMSSIYDLKNQFSLINVDILELILNGVKNNEISENFYINVSNDLMNKNKCLATICHIDIPRI